MTTALEEDSKKVGRVGSVTVIINGFDLLVANWNLHKRLPMMPRGPIHHDNANTYDGVIHYPVRALW